MANLKARLTKVEAERQEALAEERLLHDLVLRKPKPADKKTGG